MLKPNMPKKMPPKGDMKAKEMMQEGKRMMAKGQAMMKKAKMMH